MRPRLDLPRDRLLLELGRRGPSTATELAAALEVSAATALRMLQEAGPAVVQTGQARSRRYAATRALRGSFHAQPVYAVDEQGGVGTLGELALIRPQGSLLKLLSGCWPLPAESRGGWWGGLPYPLLDMRPQGFMGRQLAASVHDSLEISADPRAWSDDDVLTVLLHHGHDLPGNLLLGDRALRQWQAQCVEDAAPLSERKLARAYPALAERALAAGVPGSSAGGEFAKFTASRDGPHAGALTPHVIVKFTGAGGSAAEQRWADLLICEYHGAQALATIAGQEAARCRVLQFGGRTFLEVERFDRVGRWGRRPLVSVAMADAGLVGASTRDWPTLLERFQTLGLCNANTATAAAERWWFGRLVANTDMHNGNLSLHPVQTVDQPARFVLAPSYDMLPMAYAPLPGGEVPPRDFKPALPLPGEAVAWRSAAQAAAAMWAAVADDERVSAHFRDQAQANGQSVQRAIAQAVRPFSRAALPTKSPRRPPVPSTRGRVGAGRRV